MDALITITALLAYYNLVALMLNFPEPHEKLDKPD